MDAKNDLQYPYITILDCHMMNFVCVTHLSHLSADAPALRRTPCGETS